LVADKNKKKTTVEGKGSNASQRARERGRPFIRYEEGGQVTRSAEGKV